MNQYDAHVIDARAVRTLFFYELSPGKTAELRASYLVPIDKVLWAARRMCESRRMELENTWSDDLARLQSSLNERRGLCPAPAR